MTAATDGAEGARLLRPDAMWVDPEACIECGICEEVAPGIMGDPRYVPVTPESLEAMSICPTGAIRWLEGKERE